MADVLACVGIAILYGCGVLIMSSIPLLFRQMKTKKYLRLCILKILHKKKKIILQKN